MNEDEKKRIGPDIYDLEEITISAEATQPTIEIAQQPEFYKIPKRFGTVPVDELPLGYVKGKGYSDKFPFIKLPFQKMEEIKFGNRSDFTNRIYWGDNLHVMRMLPSESIDLIYIDPPFFSGRNYNVIFGDENEVRSFSDIWDGGLPTYLIWLNSRLLEMKRLLKPTGSIYVHLDWHAVHYVKVEMDKIFGTGSVNASGTGFKREIIWATFDTSGYKSQANNWTRSHDTILFYSKGTDYYFEKQYWDHVPEYISRFKKVDEHGRRYRDDRPGRRRQYLNETKGKLIGDVWDDIDSFQQASTNPEYIGYPTQKREALVKRIIESSCPKDGVVADFFCGGGTTSVVAEKLSRRWIVSDISRIAVEIAKGRVFKVIKERVDNMNSPNIEILSWGYYDISSLSKLTDEDFRSFILEAFGARKVSDPFIAGLKQGIPVWIGPKGHENLVDENPVLEFAEYLEKYYENRKKGIMIAWQFSERAKQAQEMLAKLGAGIDFISIDLVPIGSNNFKKHIVEKNEDYAGFLRFILPPVGRLRVKRIADRAYEFDFSESVSLNNGKIVNIQADFDFDGIFTPTTGFAITGGRNKEKDLILTIEFQKSGRTETAFKIEDDQGGETLIIRELEVS